MRYQNIFSGNPRINELIENILDELCPFLEEQANEISELTAIGKALGNGKDLTMLLEMIISIARRFTKADGGTLYLVDRELKHLEFHVIHNESLQIKQRGRCDQFPPVPLYLDEKTPNLANVSSYVFHTGETVSIEDVYRTNRFRFEGTREFDRTLDYRSCSMIVIPMKNHQEDIIGILQLINARSADSQKVVPFSPDALEKAVALASQASVILTQQMLIYEMQQLFEAFIKAIAVSIDEKSRHTGGHIQRVTELSLMIAEKINEDNACFNSLNLNRDEIDELRIASLMHDTGKITTPEHIIGKSTRLETVLDRIELLKTRWELFKTSRELVAAQKKLALAGHEIPQPEADVIDTACQKEIELLEKEFITIQSVNTSRERLSEDQLAALKNIHAKSYTVSGRTLPCLTENEFENLSIETGTLTASEREVIKSHAHLTEKILNKLPWPKNLARIPFIAGAHHEKLNGTGYPLGLEEKDLNIQARILAVADVFEALSAPDRPYKNSRPLSDVEKILRKLGEDGSLDKNVIQILFQSNTHLAYAKKHLTAAQIRG